MRNEKSSDGNGRTVESNLMHMSQKDAQNLSKCPLEPLKPVKPLNLSTHNQPFANHNPQFTSVQCRQTSEN